MPSRQFFNQPFKSARHLIPSLRILPLLHSPILPRGTQEPRIPSITSKVATELGLKPSGKVKVRGVGPAGSSQEHDSNTYLVNVFLPNNVGLAGVRVSENAVEGCDVLIGMDVITTGDLAITNHNGKTTFSFRVPLCEEIDFVAEIQEHNRRVGGVKSPLDPDQQRQLRNKRKAMRKKGH